MKKILFATTALVATAGVASAQGVEVTGFAEFGVFSDENAMGVDNMQIHTDWNVTFSMSGTADNGLTFGAAIDLEDGVNTAIDTTVDTQAPTATVFLSYGGARLTAGDTDSAFDFAMQEVAIGDTIRDDHTIHPGYSGNSALDEALDSQVVRFDYAFNSFTGSLSVNADDAGVLDPTWAIGVQYDAELAGLNLGIGLGYIKADDSLAGYDEIMGISLDTTFNNGLQAIVNYSSWSDAGGLDDASHMAIGLGYSMNALTVGVNYGVYDLPGGDSEGYGLAVNYDLGGGLEVQFGYGGGDPVVGTYEDTYSLGLAMSF